jgi:hypothetical protein
MGPEAFQRPRDITSEWRVALVSSLVLSVLATNITASDTFHQDG